jgi:hypothetical protein
MDSWEDGIENLVKKNCLVQFNKLNLKYALWVA